MRLSKCWSCGERKVKHTDAHAPHCDKCWERVEKMMESPTVSFSLEKYLTTDWDHWRRES